ncbi:MAG: alpha/beta hydrolase family protein [Planctomycetota bacterium]
MQLASRLLLPQLITALVLCLDLPVTATAQDRSLADLPELSRFFEAEVTSIENSTDLTRYSTLDRWQEDRPKLRQQLFDMLGLAPLPQKTPLVPVITGIVEHPDFIVERLHFQSLPGLYVTGNLYRPKTQTGPLPTILYVCGHGKVKQDGISYGNKTHYQHHGGWFARNGYVCLTIDTLQLGEIEGIHHGTNNLNRWWWNSRGYTPAGVEAWNCIRALDYLETRPEVDASKLGVTGRSGGGAYSWWIAALDDRIQCAVPVAGITSLRTHVVDGCVEGHCDCMYMLNFHRWDFAMVAALVAPRPLLISNTDKDGIFPLEGVVEIHRQTRHIYRLYDADRQLGLQITEGPHEDTQELHIHAFRWFNRFFRNDKSPIETTAVKFFQPPQLRVFTELPADELNTTIDQTFVPPAPIRSAADVLAQQTVFAAELANSLQKRCFSAWRDPVLRESSLTSDERGAFTIVDFTPPFNPSHTLKIFNSPATPLDKLEHVELIVALDPESAEQALATARESSDAAPAVFIIPFNAHAYTQLNAARQIHIARRFQLLGMTIDSVRVESIRRALQELRKHCTRLTTLHIRAATGSELLVTLASLYEPPAQRLLLPNLAPDLDQQPSILNLTRTVSLDLLPLAAAWQTPIVTQTPATRLPLAAAVIADPKWQGKTIEFAE